MFIRSVVSVAALVGLTACGGGGAGNLGNPSDLSNYPGASYDDLATAVPYLAGYVNSATLDVNDLPPIETDLTYFGAMLLGEDLSDDTTKNGYVGQVRLFVNFDTKTIDGTATNFYLTGLNTGGENGGNPDGRDLGGPYTGLNGTLDLVLKEDTWLGSEFELDVDGTVNSMVISGTLDDGSFKNSQRVDGTVGVYARCIGSCELNVFDGNNLNAVLAAD